MTVPSYTGSVAIELGLAEQWVIHHLMLDAAGLGRADDDPEEPPQHVVGVLRKVEDGRHQFTPFELDQIRYACQSYTNAVDTPDADRVVAAGVVERIDDALDEGPGGHP